jgi:sRNA-binding regulator protein Hfq
MEAAGPSSSQDLLLRPAKDSRVRVNIFLNGKSVAGKVALVPG